MKEESFPEPKVIDVKDLNDKFAIVIGVKIKYNVK